jgi:hypothetical protein
MFKKADFDCSRSGSLRAVFNRKSASRSLADRDTPAACPFYGNVISVSWQEVEK